MSFAGLPVCRFRNMQICRLVRCCFFTRRRREGDAEAAQWRWAPYHSKYRVGDKGPTDEDRLRQDMAGHAYDIRPLIRFGGGGVGAPVLPPGLDFSALARISAEAVW